MRSQPTQRNIQNTIIAVRKDTGKQSATQRKKKWAKSIRINLLKIREKKTHSTADAVFADQIKIDLR